MSKGSSGVLVAAMIAALIGMVWVVTGAHEQGVHYYNIDSTIFPTETPTETIEATPTDVVATVTPTDVPTDEPTPTETVEESPTPTDISFTPAPCPKTCPHNPLTEQVVNTCPNTPVNDMCRCSIKKIGQGGQGVSNRPCKQGIDCTGKVCEPTLVFSTSTTGVWDTSTTYLKDPCVDALGDGQCICKVRKIIVKGNTQTGQILTLSDTTFLGKCK